MQSKGMLWHDNKVTFYNGKMIWNFVVVIMLCECELMNVIWM